MNDLNDEQQIDLESTKTNKPKKDGIQLLGELVVLEKKEFSKKIKQIKKESEKLRVNMELSKLTDTLKFEAEKHRVQHEEMIRQKTAEIKMSFQVKTDQLHLLKQENKSKSYQAAISSADKDLNMIENSSLRDEMKTRLVSRVVETLDQTLAALDS